MININKGGKIICGLDMYLTRKHYIGGQYDFRNVEGEINLVIKGKKLPIDLKKISYIEEEVGYWRKANAIHKWFVDNVQDGEDDCKSYYVGKENLEELLDKCKEVKRVAIMKEGKVKNGETYKDGKWEVNYEDGITIVNPEKIAKILPTQSGFFFGCTDYDEFYMRDIDYTIEMLEEILEEHKKLEELGFTPEYEYRASW